MEGCMLRYWDNGLGYPLGQVRYNGLEILQCSRKTERLMSEGAPTLGFVS